MLWGFVRGFASIIPMVQPALVVVRLLPASALRQTFRVVPPEVRVPAPKIAPAAMPDVFIAAAPRAAPPPSAKPERVAPGPESISAPSVPPPPDYLISLLRHLNAFKRYPFQALQRREQGTVRLRFVMDRMGHVLSYEVVGSSGFADLDEEAREMIRNAQPLPPAPPDYPGTTFDLILPLVFSLR